MRPNLPAGVTILGATGSIGASTLDVIARHPARYRVHALTAHRDDARLARLCARYRPAYAVIADTAAAARLTARLADVAPGTQVLAGPQALCEVAAHPDAPLVMAAIVGAAGLLPTLAAVCAGKRVLLANKEALVMTGALFMEQVHRCGAELLPIDSEHNAVFQCLPNHYPVGLAGVGVRRILLTASGGPFCRTPLQDLVQVTPREACAHPNWSMGRKISVDSATMMNKGLEVIEACHLFGVRPAQVEVVLHAQSVVHSLVEYVDGSVLAQLGHPDMRTPIAHALAWPERLDTGLPPLDLAGIGRLDFAAPDPQRFPCLALAYHALALGGTAPTILNAANEVAVAAFLAGSLAFTRIAAVVEDTLAALASRPAASFDIVLEDDAAARTIATALLTPARRRAAL